MDDQVEPVFVVGVAGDRFDLLTPDARHAVAGAQVVVGGRRLLGAWESWRRATSGPVPETVEIGRDTAAVAEAVRRAAHSGARVCVLASGDPGFFGIVRALSRTLDRRALRVLPALSSVATAFARVALPWDDAAVVSAHGRPLADALAAIVSARKCAVLTAPGSPPQALGAALLHMGVEMDLVAVCSHLGSAGESVEELTLGDLAAGSFDPLSVVVLVQGGASWHSSVSAASSVSGTSGACADKVLGWGLPEERFDHRGDMITKAEVRAVAISKLELPRSGVLWDVGAGSGSVAIECAMLCPELEVFAIEQRAATAGRIAGNATALGARVKVETGTAPAALDALPSPDRVFVGGGGLPVLDAVLGRLRRGGRVVATYAAMDRAAAGASRLGKVVQLSVARGATLPDGGWRLEAQHPVFVVWGPA